MLRPPDDVLGRPLLDQVACVQHEYPVGDVAGARDVVRHEDHGEAEPALQLLDLHHERPLGDDVEGGRRLVHDQVGRNSSASAIIARWRMPPESWCG
jgi:hypothetical protein